MNKIEKISSYKLGISRSMKELGKKDKVLFLGENIINSGRIYGTLDEVSKKKCMEMPVAENLIAGTAIGLSLTGFIPICIFQRMDFMLIAADAIINHAALIPKMSGGSVRLPLIFRTVKGSLNNRFYVGMQHSKNLSYVFKNWIRVIELRRRDKAMDIYEEAYKCGEPTLVVEDYSLY